MNRENRLSLLHSRYNPQAEAERYVASLSFGEKPRFFILIEPGLAYITAPLKNRFPGAKLIALHAAKRDCDEPGCTMQKSQDLPEQPDSQWFPGTELSVQGFLEREIPDSAAGDIRILEWRPALAVYGGLYLALVEEAAAFIKRSDANYRTYRAFGKRWFRNFFKNLSIIRHVICPERLKMPLLVTGAGPGLEDSIPLIAPNERPFILAVSASAPALKAHGIIPDMLISTDGGIWAAFHLFECFRTDGRTRAPSPIAAALTAALPSQCESLPILPICDGSLWQTLILKALGIPFVLLPQRGTVSAAALDLAFALSEGPIYIAGMNLANKDIKSHSRPYSLDRFMEEKAARLNPVYCQAYNRSSMLKAGGSYGIYASWFEKQLAAYPKRLYSLGKNSPVFSSLELSSSKNAAEHEDNKHLPVNFEIITLESTGKISEKAYAVLEQALKDPVHSPALRKELAPVLPDSREYTSIDELIKALRHG